MKLIKTIIFFSIIFLTFLYGIGVGTYKWFPYEEVRMLKWSLTSDKRIQSNYNKTLNNNLKIVEYNPSDLIKLRKKINKFIIPDIELQMSFETSDNKIYISTNYYGVKSNAILTKSLKPKNKCLRIYIQGHGGNPFDYDYHSKLVDDFLETGCDVLSMSMLGLGLNSGNASFPIRSSKMELNAKQAREHGNYSFFYDEKNPQLDPLSLFLYPHIAIIDSTINKFQYEDILIMGISGGGWYTVWLSALMPNLNSAISYSGSLPLAYRKFGENRGDWEQVYSKVYHQINYIELYQMMLINNDGIRNRKATLVYNDDDPCCFANPYALSFQKAIKNSPIFPSIIIDKSDRHHIRPQLIKSIINKNK